MKTNLATTFETQLKTAGTPIERSFSLLEGEEKPVPKLFAQTQAIHGLQEGVLKPVSDRAVNIGSPMLSIDGIEGLEYAAVSTGTDAEDVPFWQVVVRDTQTTNVLQAEVSESGERWQLFSMNDGQGRIKQEAVIWDDAPEHAMTQFVLKALSSVDIVNAAEIMRAQKKAALARFNEFRSQLDAEMPNHILFDAKKLESLLSGYSQIGFMSLKPVDVSHATKWDSEKLSRWHHIDTAPAAVRTLLAAETFGVQVKASTTVKQFSQPK